MTANEGNQRHDVTGQVTMAASEGYQRHDVTGQVTMAASEGNQIHDKTEQVTLAASEGNPRQDGTGQVTMAASEGNQRHDMTGQVTMAASEGNPRQDVTGPVTMAESEGNQRHDMTGQVTMAAGEATGDSEEEEGTAIVGQGQFDLQHPIAQAVQHSGGVTLKGEINIGGKIKKTENVFHDQRVIYKSKNFITKNEVHQHLHNTPESSQPQFSPSCSSIEDQSRVQIDILGEVFVETERYQIALDIVRRIGVLIIVGPPATGKTWLGLSILRHYATSESCVPLVLETYEEWRKHVGGGGKTKKVVLLDFDKRLLKDHLTTLKAFAKDGKCLTVVTVTDTLFTNSGLGGQGLADCVLDISLTGPFSVDEKKEIMTRHLAHRSKSFSGTVFEEVLTVDNSGCCFPYVVNSLQNR